MVGLESKDGKQLLEKAKDKLKEIQKVFTFPMIQKKYTFDEQLHYLYPRQLFDNFKKENGLHLYTRSVSKRRRLIKEMLDLYAAREIELPIFHFAMFCINHGHGFYEDYTEKELGKRRYELFQTIPRYELPTNDEFIISLWHSLIDRLPNHRDWYYHPSFSQVRILFHADLFERYVGKGYDCDWVEPVSGRDEKHILTWTAEKDPMASHTKSENMNEGELILGSSVSGLRHYVQGEPVHAGSYMEVRFGDGWIAGRYEWSFDAEDPIRIYSRNSCIQIKHGHLVRIKK